jgi:isopentenyl phosphate kinase
MEKEGLSGFLKKTPLFILKIGGAAATFKESNELKAHEDVIRQIAREIKQAKTEKKFRLMAVHGAGPFGHKLVTDYKIKDGLKSENDARGFVRTHNSMQDLNKVFINVFREEGLLGFPLQSAALITQKNKKICSFNTKIIEELWKISEEIIPVMYGDMVLDKNLKASVVSGDAIISFLGKKLNAQKIFFGTNVSGIFTADPNVVKGAELIQKIDKKNFDEVLKKVEEAKTVDVTGGMRGKLKELRRELKGKDIFVFDATHKGKLLSLFRGQKTICTEIRF